MLRLSMCCLVLLSGCRASPEPTPQSPLSIGLLAGEWQVELRNGSLLPFDRIPVLGAPPPFLTGELSLSPSIESADQGTARRPLEGKLVGTLAHAEADVPRITFPASASLGDDGKVRVTLTFPGECPCSTLVLEGLLVDQVVRGRFTHTTGNHTAGGQFAMHRAGSGSS